MTRWMMRLAFALAMIGSAACKKKEETLSPPTPAPADAAAVPVAADAAAPAEPYRMKKGGDSELIKLDVPAGWKRDDGDSATITHVVKDPSLDGGKLGIEVTLEQMRVSSDMKKPTDWGDAEASFMKAKITKTETIGKATVFHFKADREWYWAYAALEGTTWRCGGDLFTDQKLAAVKDAVAVGRKLCASMTR